MSVTDTATKEGPVAPTKGSLPAEMVFRLTCEACGKWAGHWRVGADLVLMCGPCKKLASRAYAAGALAPDDYGRDAVLAAARRDT